MAAATSLAEQRRSEAAKVLSHGASPVDPDDNADEDDQEDKPAGKKRKTKKTKKIVFIIELLAPPPAEPAPAVLLSPSSTKNLVTVRAFSRCLMSKSKVTLVGVNRCYQGSRRC
jgi:hypothetical protein